MNKSACGIFTLHPWELPWELHESHPNTARLKERMQKNLLDLINQQHITHFWLVMDQGVPCYAAEILLALKKIYPLHLTCLIPFEEQHLNWPEPERDLYFSIMQRCDQEYLLSHGFSIDCYQQSVQQLLIQCGALYVVWSGKPSDAGDAISLAQRSSRQVFALNVQQIAAT